MVSRLRAPALSTAAALVVSLVAYVPVLLSGHITRDSGVFLYTGMVVSRGGMPYVDSWDHKGPLLAVFEAVAWKLGGGILGAVVVEAVVLFIGLAIAGAIWSRWIREGAAVVVLLVGVTYLATYEGGNFTETWLLPFQLVAYSLVADCLIRFGRGAPPRVVAPLGAALGLALAVALFTRMNNAAGLVVVALFAFAMLHRRMLLMGALVAVGAVIGTGLFVWLWTGDALRAAVDQYVIYNFSYSEGASLGDRITSFATLAQLLVSGAIVAAALLTVGAWMLVRPAANAPRRTGGYLAAVFLAVGGVDALSQMASGRPYPHYLVVAIAGFAVALVVAAADIRTAAGRWWRAERAVPKRLGRIAGIAGLSALVLASSGATAAAGLRTTTESGVFVEGSYQQRIVERVLKETSADDKVLVHGAETWVLAASQRLSPTSITYSLPVEQGYGGLPEQYVSEIMASPPALIVESPASCGISIACAPAEDHFAGLAPWVASSYELEGDVAGFLFWRQTDS